MKKTHQKFIEEIKDRPFVAIGEYTRTKDKMLFSCNVCSHEWSAQPHNILKGTGCPKCAYRKKTDALRGKAGENNILEDNGDWLLVDISTQKHPCATMAVDTDVWDKYEGGRVHAVHNFGRKYICAMNYNNGAEKRFHNFVMVANKPLMIDHINHGSMTFVDNRRSNLRRCTSSQNNMNRGIQDNNKSGTTGVSWYERGQTWRAQIMVDLKTIHLGYFDNIDIAIGARQQAEREYFGEFRHKA